MEATLAGINPEERAEIEALTRGGHMHQAEQQLLNYVLEEDHSKELRRFGRKKSRRDENNLHERMYWLALIPTAIILYFILSLLFTGHVAGHVIGHPR